MHAAYFGSCTVESVTTLIIACSFGFTIFVTVYMTASFSGQCLIPADNSMLSAYDSASHRSHGMHGLYASACIRLALMSSQLHL